jgi:hypothetical protein
MTWQNRRVSRERTQNTVTDAIINVTFLQIKLQAHLKRFVFTKSRRKVQNADLSQTLVTEGVAKNQMQ